MRPRIAARAVSFVGVGTLLVALQGAGATTAQADPVFTGGNGMTVTVTGGPVALIGDNGHSCTDPLNSGHTAHLSGPLTFNYTYPANGFLVITAVGEGSGFENFDFESPLPSSIVIPADGVGNQVGSAGHAGFQCDDATSPTTMRFVVTLDGPQLDQVVGTVQLSNVD